MAFRAKDVVLAGLASFVAWGYATHWFPAIRFAGHGIVVGALLTGAGLLALATLTVRGPLYGPGIAEAAAAETTATSTSASTSTSSKAAAMAAIRISRRPRGVAFVSPEHWPGEVAALRAHSDYSPIPLYPQSPRVSAALDELLENILRTYIRSWYASIGPSAVFPNAVDATIRVALGSLRDRLLAVDDVVEVLTGRLVPILTAHFHDFNEAERAVRGRKLNRSVTESDELDLAIAAKYRDNRISRGAVGGGLHPAASLSYSDTNTRLVRQDYLRRLVASRLLPQLLPASFLASRPVAALVREIVACAVLYPVMQLLAEPDTWNQLMENYGRTMLQDRSTVRKLRAALDQHASPVPRSNRPTTAFPRLAVGDSERRFERFVRSVRKVNNLSDARRFRSEVASQLKRDLQSQQLQQLQYLQRQQLGTAGPAAESQDQAVYLRRLDMCKRLLDQKVQYLAAGGDRRTNGSSDMSSSGATGMGQGPGPIGIGLGGGAATNQMPAVSRLEMASLGELLRDAAGMSYFMEYMDRQRMLPLVQFWLVVDGFRNPLEDEDDDADGDANNEPLPSSLPAWTDSDRLDLAQIDQAYLVRPELHIPETSRRAVQVFLEAGTGATPAQYYRARRAILQCQTTVLEEMKAKYFQGFKRSDLFYKCLAAEEAAQTNSSSSMSTPSPARPAWPAKPSRPASRAEERAPTLPTSVGTASQAAVKTTPTSRLRTKLQPTRRAESSTDLRATATTAAAAVASSNGNGHGMGNGNGNDFLFAGERHGNPSVRRSLDERRTPSPLFGDDDDFFSSAGGSNNSHSINHNTNNNEHDVLADSVQSLDQTEVPHTEVLDTKVVEAVEEALTNIMEDRPPTTAADLRASLFGTDDSVGGGGGGGGGGGSSIFSGMDGGESRESPRGSVDLQRRSSPPAPRKETEKPSIASLGLVSAASRIGVFEDDDLFGDEGKYLSDEEEDGAEGGGGGGNGGAREGMEKGSKEEDEETVHEAAPGDLGLAEAITALTDDIERLAAQDAVVDSLLRKAELTNNTAELRILRKSKSSLQREMRRKELQRQQYVVQESDNSLFGRATVQLTTIQVGHDEAHGGKEYARYAIEVQRAAGETVPAAVWAVWRRYSEFWALHQRLRARYPSVRSLDFPRRRVIMMKLQGDFLQKRRAALERYLRALLLLPDVCRSRDLRAFLSQRVIGHGGGGRGEGGGGGGGGGGGEDGEGNKDVMSRLYESVADGVEDILGSIPVLDQLSLAGQSLIAAATSQLQGGGGGTGTGGERSSVATVGESAEAAAELAAFEEQTGSNNSGNNENEGQTLLEAAEAPPFVKPICDIFLEVFELNRGNNWLRGRAVVVVLHQLLGGTIERKLRENVRLAVQEEDALLRYLALVQETLFGGAASPGRTTAQKTRTRTEAGLMLATLVPDLAGSVVGRLNAQAASRRIFATFNNSRLNAHLAFTLLDEIVDILFGDLRGVA
ncbi:intermediate filament protein [Grosmannia clavigera kw1407]|uniref:Intermediate filament protein n=1 Tax=Grosmannia clavigera (strain kw1407 / UAMH 11150) TaxID=655863 RepID=F0XKF9_GROCL|nr:intermediate filament protein [Grosmannia clavigera kw1407]EFX01790.1 intermediate filament protein [Grosmannia clavigera kw1407]